MWGSGWLATFLLFCAWLLQLFTIIGGLNNLPFLNEAYYTRVQSNNQADRFYLWNSCSENPLNTVSNCGAPVAGYQWGNQAPYNTVPGITGHSQTFFALSAVTWIAFGITTLTLLSSLITHCCCRRRMASRWFDFNHFWWGFIAWLAQLVAFVLAIIFGTRGGSLIENNLPNSSYSLGPSTWMSLGAFLALTLSMIMFCCGFCLAKKRKNRQTVDPTYDDQAQYAQTKESRGWFGRKKNAPVQDPEMAYNNTGGAYNAGAYDNPATTGNTYGSKNQHNPAAGAAVAGAAGAAGAYGVHKHNQNKSTGADGTGNYDNNATTGGTSGAYGNKNYDTTTGAATGAYGAGNDNYGNTNTGTTGAYGAGSGNYDNPHATSGAYNTNTGMADNTSSVYHTPAGGFDNPSTTNGTTGYKSGTGVYDSTADGYDNLTSYDNNANNTSNKVRV
jgi:SUR7/PalI family